MSVSSVVRFTNDAAGLEKTLRLLQAFCTIAIGLVSPSPELQVWSRARAQLNLGRRYFRLLKWYPCWNQAVAAIHNEQGVFQKSLDVVKWSLLGMYFFLEMFTITNTMGLTEYAWASTFQLEANKCWFYSLLVSVLLSLKDLRGYPPPSRLKTSPPRKPVKSKEGNAPQGETLKQPKGKSPGEVRGQLLIDCCDLVIPGSAVGWIPAPLTLVGVAMTISTVLAGQQIWSRVQNEAR